MTQHKMLLSGKKKSPQHEVKGLTSTAVCVAVMVMEDSQGSDAELLPSVSSVRGHPPPRSPSQTWLFRSLSPPRCTADE